MGTFNSRGNVPLPSGIQVKLTTSTLYDVVSLSEIHLRLDKSAAQSVARAAVQILQARITSTRASTVHKSQPILCVVHAAQMVDPHTLGRR